MFVNNCFQQNIIKNQYFYDIMGEEDWRVITQQSNWG
jgi:hypothetical protein